ncbi:MAG: hypothetical protein IRZ00_13020 [Gemmatimonadetes bacterium]|nr:hypothetical protein [Gemmatimonadota bacterium]
MNRLYRIRIRPRGPWRTPWQADTLAGLLCWMCARTEGGDVLRARITEPMLEGAPPFVLSDAFPGDLLPMPLAVRQAEWAPADRKLVKRARWLRPAAFERARRGEALGTADLVLESPIAEHDHTRNTLGRLNDTTGESGSLFTLAEARLDPRAAAMGGADWLSVYVRVQADAADLLLGLFEELAGVGFGADAAVGKGAFDFPDGAPDLEPVDFPADPQPEAASVIVLSTFQPARSDPVRGIWEAFTKCGVLGPSLGLDEKQVRKRPLLLVRPGACFQAPAGAPGFLGRAVPMDELLPPDPSARLRARGIEVVHPAFGLTVPASLRLP